MSAEVVSEVYEVPYLYCTLCNHDLNHPSYLICSHPILGVPLCIICNQEITSSDLFDENIEISDVCSWCGDGGELFMCSNTEGNCERSFCTACLTANLESELESIKNNDNWFCLCCNTEPLVRFHKAAEIGSANSMYTCSSEALEKLFDGAKTYAIEGTADKEAAETMISSEAVLETKDNTSTDAKVPPEENKEEGSSSDDDDDEDDEESNGVLMRDILIYSALVEGSNEATTALENETLRNKEAEIRQELRDRMRQSATPGARYGMMYAPLSCVKRQSIEQCSK
jgi:hypothetical protein